MGTQKEIKIYLFQHFIQTVSGNQQLNDLLKYTNLNIKQHEAQIFCITPHFL